MAKWESTNRFTKGLIVFVSLTGLALGGLLCFALGGFHSAALVTGFLLSWMIYLCHTPLPSGGAGDFGGDGGGGGGDGA